MGKFSILTSLKLDTGNYEQGINKVKKESNGLGNSITSSFAKIGVAVASVYGAFETFRSTLRSVQSAGDKVEQVMGGISEGVTYLQQSLMNLDFDNLIDGFIRANEVGREYIKILDEIGDRDRALGIRDAKLKLQLAELELVIRSNTSTVLEKQEAITQRRLLLENAMNDKMKTREMSLQNEYNRLKNLYKLTDEQTSAMINYVENYDQIMDSGGFDKINSIFQGKEKIKEMTNEIANMTQAMSYMRSVDAIENQKLKIEEKKLEQNKLKDIVQMNEQSLTDIEKAWMISHQNLTDEVRNQLGNVLKEYYNSQTEIITELTKTERLDKRVNNELVRSSEEILEAQIGSIKELQDRLSDAKNSFNMATTASERNFFSDVINDLQSQINILLMEPQRADVNSLQSMKMSDNNLIPTTINLPTIEQRETKNQFEASYTGGMAFIDVLDNINTKMMLLDVGMDGVEAGFTSMFESGSGAGHAFIGTLIKVVQGLLAASIASMMAEESKKGLVGLITASVGVAALSALWNTKVPKFADGGIVSGPTVGLMGEYAGAKNNPEVIAPLSKLTQLLNINNGNTTFIIERDKLFGLTESYKKERVYFG